jgi:hypothetical protein
MSAECKPQDGVLDLGALYRSHAKAWTRDSMAFEREDISDGVFDPAFRPVAGFRNDALGRRVYLAHGRICDGFAITEEGILSLYADVLGLPEGPGVSWRSVQVTVGGRPTPMPHKVPELMRDFALNLAARCQHIEESTMLEMFGYLEGEMLRIHPFPDLNGRMSRLLMVAMARNLGLPPVFPIYPTLTRPHYFSRLAAYEMSKNPKGMIPLWEERLAHALSLVGCETWADWRIRAGSLVKVPAG